MCVYNRVHCVASACGCDACWGLHAFYPPAGRRDWNASAVRRVPSAVLCMLANTTALMFCILSPHMQQRIYVHANFNQILFAKCVRIAARAGLRSTKQQLVESLVGMSLYVEHACSNKLRARIPVPERPVYEILTHGCFLGCKLCSDRFVFFLSL